MVNKYSHTMLPGKIFFYQQAVLANEVRFFDDENGWLNRVNRHHERGKTGESE